METLLIYLYDMRKRTKYKKYFRTLCMTILPLVFMLMGCAEDELVGDGTGHTTGKTVMVSLQVNIPPIANPKSLNESLEAKAFSGFGDGSGAPFTVVLEKEKEEKPPVPTRASDGTTKLYNLWLFQFKEDGSINGTPHKISDTMNAINDMVTIDVPLVVAENQTLYLLALGPKLNYDMSEVRSLSDLEKQSFKYLTNAEGRTKSLITSDDEVPFAGKVSGITVVDIDEGNRGLIEYNKPSGFVGGIEIRRLMARITLRYKFEVENYKLQGLKLLNVNNAIRLTNPDKNPDTDTYAIFEMDEFSKPDPNGFYTVTWYIAQNCQGTVDTILSEDKRYHKVVNNKEVGDAPALGTQIEAWAYSTATSNKYAIYQMYIGNNNINNFDVEANHFYNLRTTIDAEISSAKNDERIRAYSATQYVEFHASNNVSTSGGALFDYKYNSSGINYDLDAAYDVRPIVVQTQGKIVKVGIYTDESCTLQASPADSWLHVSSSPNYTEAYNSAEKLNTSIKASTILPTQVKFYLYNKEYINDEDGQFIDPGENDKNGKRSIYIKVSTTTNDAGTIEPASHIFRLDQRPAIYAGHFGGEKDANGNYTMGLVHDRLSKYAVNAKPLVDITIGKIQYGYDRIETAKKFYMTDDMNNGKIATKNLAENTGNLTWSGDIPIPQKDASGHVLLYQYQYPGSSFCARICYDKNRDEDGNGRIEGEEFKWYLPASNQLIGIYVGSPLLAAPDGSGTTTEDGIGDVKRWYSGINSYYKTSVGSGRCVRNVSLPDNLK